MDNILVSVKKMLGIQEEYTHFDPDIILNINAVLLTLTQIGIGPENGFLLTTGEEVWADFLGDRKDLEAVKTFIYLKVRILFDPPSNAFVLEAMERQIKEFEFRLNVQVDKGTTSIEEGEIIDEY